MQLSTIELSITTCNSQLDPTVSACTFSGTTIRRQEGPYDLLTQDQYLKEKCSQIPGLSTGVLEQPLSSHFPLPSNT